MLLTIIIPVYNVEKYLPKCLDSCINQDISSSEYEIICINDGSPDSCGKILSIYSDKYSNVKVITQENHGLSIARNNGLALASGEYIWFVDSDDYLPNNSLFGIIEKLKKYKPDILQINYNNIWESEHKESPIIDFTHLDSEISTGKEITAGDGLPSPAQLSIYKKDLLNQYHIKFYEGIYHEDLEFKPRVTYYANKIMWHTPIVYNFLQNRIGSITQHYKPKNAQDLLIVIDNLHLFARNNVKEEPCKKGIYRKIALDLNTLFMVIRTLDIQDRRDILLRLNNMKYIFQDLIESGNLKYILEGLVLKINVELGYHLIDNIKTISQSKTKIISNIRNTLVALLHQFKENHKLV